MNELRSLAVEPAHDVLDHAVLAGGIQRLKHDEDRPAVGGIKPLLEIGEPLDITCQNSLGLGLIEIEAAGIGRIDLCQSEIFRIVDAESLGGNFNHYLFIRQTVGHHQTVLITSWQG